MDDEFFENADQLHEALGLKGANEYERYSPFKNKKVGFSIQRSYPKDIKYVPVKGADGSDDTVVMIRVSYDHPSESEKEADPEKVPIRLDIGTWSRYRANHFGWGHDNKDCPSKESVEKSLSTPRPLTLTSNDRYFYNHRKKCFVDVKGNDIDGKEIIEKLYRQHSYTSHALKGFSIRFKIAARDLEVRILAWIIRFLKFLLHACFGRKLGSDKVEEKHMLVEYKKEDLEYSTESVLNFYGYRATKNVIITFCILAILLYSAYFIVGKENEYLKGVAGRPFLVLCFSLVLLWMFDHLLPLLILWFMNITIRHRIKLQDLPLKVRIK